VPLLTDHPLARTGPTEARRRELAATVIAVFATGATGGERLAALYSGILLAREDPATAALVLEATETIVATSKRMSVDEARGYLRGTLRTAMRTDAPPAERDASPATPEGGA
jgi:hypothetical protein